MHIKACIFDLDGVIVDTAKYHFRAWKRLTDQMGISFSEEDNEHLKGVSRMASLDIILKLGGRTLSEKEKLEFATQKNDWYVEYISRMTPDEILPGAVKFITELRKANIKTAIGSASKNTPMILERTGIKNLFDGVADGNNVKNAKPDPEVFQTAARLIKVMDEECVVFEDAVAGIQAALNAGMKSIGIGSEKILRKAHMVIPGLSEMNLEKLKLFEKANYYE
jgi:beta-phosphoglucomutase